MEKSTTRHKSNRPTYKKHSPQTKNVLETMCGNGRISIHLAKIGYNVTGIEFNKTYIDNAKKKAKEYNVEDKANFLHCDIRKFRQIL
ncbi:MAG: class I SAM-dependent methyltransferase [Candidatus Omnitrophica bacterium]|nr:class I SAM-dependent methyltransferase [Candidatus Omnitrophota bacterium]